VYDPDYALNPKADEPAERIQRAQNLCRPSRDIDPRIHAGAEDKTRQDKTRRDVLFFERSVMLVPSLSGKPSGILRMKTQPQTHLFCVVSRSLSSEGRDLD
jgi:hypothetical protein